MKRFDFSNYSLETKIFAGALLLLSLVALGFAAFQSLFYSFLQFLILAVSVVLSLFANQHQFRIPKTHLTVSPRKILIFWGTIWLGAAGGVFLSAVAPLVRYRTASKDRARWIFGTLVSITATFISAKVFYLALNFFTDFSEMTVALGAVNLGAFLTAAGLMVLAHYLVSVCFTCVFARLESDYTISEIWLNKYKWTIVNYLVALGAALGLNFTFRHFGVEFGLVILALTVAGHFAHKFHLQKLAQKTREISEASRVHLATVEALATAIDARDQLGAGHVRRVQIYAVGIGEILGLPETEIDALRTGALLHDIGKLAVPDHILNKPGKLTVAEMEKMKIHSSVGASILENVPFASPVVPAVKHHHEWWDGSGYPGGLKKNEIPLTARILAIADSYDALSHERPYREAVSREDARRFLLNGAGRQFDPKLTDIFLRNLRRFEEEISAQGLARENGNWSGIEISEENNQNYVEQIKRANREVFTLYELAKVFSSSLNLQETLALFVGKIGELVPFETCLVYLLDEPGEEASVVYGKGANSAALKNKRVKKGEGATGCVLKNGGMIRNVSTALDFSFDGFDFIENYTVMASLPLVADERLIGAVSLYSADLEGYEDEHLRLLETISRIASDAILKSLHHAETESRALTDPMTGLPNARSLQVHFETEVARARRTESEFQLLMLDLDGFKKVNDNFGHKTGDLLLREISKVMRAQLRDYDFLARYAGDEFVIIAPEMSNEDVQELCGRIEKAVCDFRLPIGDEQFVKVGVSLGAASYPQAGESLDQVIVAADKAMYRVKESHKRGQTAQNTPKNLTDAAFIVELDESHIVSNAVN